MSESGHAPLLDRLSTLQARERAAFEGGTPVGELIHARTESIDMLLREAWQLAGLADDAPATLVAVGGYGRGELFPHSDIDVLILLDPAAPEPVNQAVQEFVRLCWDIGLHLGHSARTPAQCIEEGLADITVATNYLETRLLTGEARLFQQLRDAVDAADFWPAPAFFRAKREEQLARHRKYDDSGFKIEPNVKESPGGLRDIHMIRWVSQRLYGAGTLEALRDEGHITDLEYRSLCDNQNELWRVRFALHLLAGRNEERLLLNHQQALAERFGDTGDTANLAVERFMQRYFRAVMEIERLSEILLQHFEETLSATPEAPPQPLNPRFQVRQGFLETSHAQVFMQSPTAIFELFRLMQEHPALLGVRASAIRQLRAHLPLIDRAFRADPRAHALFIDILDGPRGVFDALKRMNRWGVLAAYLPEFREIVGRMQFDLFHLYTVDEHTLFVIRNLRRLAVQELTHENPHCSDVFKHIERPALLYLAALFHDIGKGRGGDHAELGAEDARRFCRDHGLTEAEVERIVWLVREHLLMSFTAQRRDIEDPQVIAQFAAAVGDRCRLDHLYLLTVADIRATNPNLWNSWRESLLRNLYRYTREHFEHGTSSNDDVVQTTRKAVLLAADESGHTREDLVRWLARLPDDYLLRYETQDILAHARRLAAIEPGGCALFIEPHPPTQSTRVLLIAPSHPALFAHIAARLDQARLNILAATLTQTHDGDVLAEFHVLDEQGQALQSTWVLEELREQLERTLREPGQPIPASRRRLPAQLRHFNIPTRVSFQDEPHLQRTLLSLETGDRPGLLAQVGHVLCDAGVRITHAKIATLGERAEDIFFLTRPEGGRCDDPVRQEDLRQRLIAALDDAPA